MEMGHGVPRWRGDKILATRTYLAYDVDVLLPLIERLERGLEIGPCPLEDEDAIVAEDVCDVAGIPLAGLADGLDEVCAGEENDADGLAGSVGALDAAHDVVEVVVEVVEDVGGGDVGVLGGLPGVDHEPLGGALDGELAHAHAVVGGSEARLAVAVADGGEVAADDIKS